MRKMALLPVLALLLLAVSNATAGIVIVDFASLTTVTDITVGGAPGALYMPGPAVGQGVTLSFDPAGGPGMAQVDSQGITGFLGYGTLTLGFERLATSLDFSFILPGVTADMAPAGLYMINPGAFTDLFAATVPPECGLPPLADGICIAGGSVHYASVDPFNNVQIMFMSDIFNIGSMQYDAEAVPEPASMALLGLGLLALGGRKLMKRRSC